MYQKQKTILIFGSTGMLGTKLYEESKERTYKTIGVSRNGQDKSIDIRDETAVTNLILCCRPDIIINSAALVSHSICESEPTLAYSVNARPVKIMAQVANKTGARLVQISTDNYYSGDGNKPHKEEDPITISSEYARTKFAGETFALNHNDSLVIRTNITGFRADSDIISFIEWAVTSLHSKKKFNLFYDYFASTISTHQAAKVIYDVLECEFRGRLNIACREVASKWEFVEAFAQEAGLSIELAQHASVHDILSARSESIGLDVTRAEQLLKRQLPTLKEVVSQLAHEYTHHYGKENK